MKVSDESRKVRHLGDLTGKEENKDEWGKTTKCEKSGISKRKIRRKERQVGENYRKGGKHR